MHKYIFIFVVLISFIQVSYAGSINQAAYRTMQAQSYRNNYRRNVSPVIPYWQAQSNYSTRNRLYRNYSHYDNTIQMYNNSVQSARRSR